VFKAMLHSDRLLPYSQILVKPEKTFHGHSSLFGSMTSEEENRLYNSEDINVMKHFFFDTGSNEK
jgi:hypothetical protein